MMRMVSELSNIEYVSLICNLSKNEKKAKRYCKKHKIDFEDIKAYDWGFDWQTPKGVY